MCYKGPALYVPYGHHHKKPDFVECEQKKVQIGKLIGTFIIPSLKRIAAKLDTYKISIF